MESKLSVKVNTCVSNANYKPLLRSQSQSGKLKKNNFSDLLERSKQFHSENNKLHSHLQIPLSVEVIIQRKIVKPFLKSRSHKNGTVQGMKSKNQSFSTPVCRSHYLR